MNDKSQTNHPLKKGERTAPFTSVSGWGLVLMGIIAVIGANVAVRGEGGSWWVNTWLITALIASVTGATTTLLKTKKHPDTRATTLMRRFALNFAPPIMAAAVLSSVMVNGFREEWLPGTWLLLYGVAVMTGGAFSVRIVPVMGLLFLFLGAFSLLTTDMYGLTAVVGPLTPGDILLIFGFGGLHMIFGLIIAWKYRA